MSVRLLRGVISGENVDLIAAPSVRSTSSAQEAACPLAETLASYELDLDRALLEKARVIKDEEPFDLGGEVSALKIMHRTEHIRENGLCHP